LPTTGEVLGLVTAPHNKNKTQKHTQDRVGFQPSAWLYPELTVINQNYFQDVLFFFSGGTEV
jgi:hypothetical protein